MVFIQFLSMFVVKNLNYPMLLLAAYCFGGPINHSLMLGEWPYSYSIFEKFLVSPHE